MTIKHAKLSASGSAKWLNCPGSVKAEESFPEVRNIYADEGTAAHELAEISLKANHPAADLISETLPESGYVVSREMSDYVQIYIDYVKSLGGSQRYEERLDFSDWVPKGFGTSDAIVIVDRTLHVIDLKYGQGYKVYAQNNTQGMLYALGALNEFGLLYDFDNVVITIVQPRLDHIDVSEPVSIIDLLKFGEFVRAKAEEAMTDNAPRKAGNAQCHFCKAKATCPELKKVTETAILTTFEQLDELPMADKLTDQELRLALYSKKLIMAWLDAVENMVLNKLNSGEGFTGYKLVSGRSSREWRDEEVAAAVLTEALGEEAYSKKLLSVAKAEIVLGKENMEIIEELIVKSVGKPTLVPESDKRPAVNITASSFD